MITNAISRRYAKALVQIGTEEGRVDEIQGQLATFEAAYSAAGLPALIADPAYPIEAKRAILTEVIARLGLADTVRNFLLLLLDRNRLAFLPQIIAGYGSFADELSGVIRPTLTSATPLAEAQIQGIRDSLASTTGKKVVLTVEVDPALIGGIVTKIGDKVFDGSVKTQLHRIQDTLQKG